MASKHEQHKLTISHYWQRCVHVMDQSKPGWVARRQEGSPSKQKSPKFVTKQGTQSVWVTCLEISQEYFHFANTAACIYVSLLNSSFREDKNLGPQNLGPGDTNLSYFPPHLVGRLRWLALENTYIILLHSWCIQS